MKYRKKPVVIEAIPFMGEESFYLMEAQWGRSFKYSSCYNKMLDTLIISTLEGDHTANKGDMIIRGVKGEYYPCKLDIFDLTYEPVA